MIDSTIAATSPAIGFEAHATRGRFNAAFFSLMGPYSSGASASTSGACSTSYPRRSSSSVPGRRQPPLPVPRGHARRHRTQPPHAPTAAGRRRTQRRPPRPPRPRRGGHRPARPQRRQRDLLTRALLGDQPRRCARRDPPDPATRRHLQLRRTRRRAGWHRHPALQRALRRPWAWTFEGCSCERDLASLICAAGFASVDIEPYRLHTPFVPFNTHIAGTAHA